MTDSWDDDVAALIEALEKNPPELHPVPPAKKKVKTPDSELLGWVRDFIQERERVSLDDICREFFPDASDDPCMYLDALTADKLITRRKWGREYEWAYKGVRGAQRKQISHRGCKHPSTPYQREICRRERNPVPPNPADWKAKQRRGRWGQFADGKVRELTAEQIRELTGPSTTPAQFARRLRAYATNYGLKCRAQQTENGLRFCLGNAQPQDQVSVRHGVPS